MDDTPWYIRVRIRTQIINPLEGPQCVWSWLIYSDNNRPILESVRKDFTSKASAQASIDRYKEKSSKDIPVYWDQDALNPTNSLEPDKVLLGRFINPVTKRAVQVYESHDNDKKRHLFWYRNLRKQMIPEGQFKESWKKA